MDDAYEEVYGVNLTTFKDLQDSLMDGRFDKLYQVVAKRAAELAGFYSNSAISSQPHDVNDAISQNTSKE
jgi:hypothetical protein